MSAAIFYEAHFRITTPLFASGSWPQDCAELRVSSLKGALRFWWRALAWPHHKSLEHMRDAEGRLFGGSRPISRAAPVLFKLKAIPASGNRPAYDLDGLPGEGLLYLGHGLWESQSPAQRDNRRRHLPLSRPCLTPGVRFTLQILVAPDSLDSHEMLALERSLKALGLIGSMGARARNGLGSLTLCELFKQSQSIWQAPKTAVELADNLRELGLQQRLDPLDRESPLPPFSAFSSRTRAVMVPANPDETALQLLDRLGRQMILFRSWGKRGAILGQRPEKNFRDDHHLMRLAAQGRRVHTHPARIVFGLPQNYYFCSLRAGTDVRSIMHERRSSPLFVHIHHPDEALAPIAILTFVPARFLPENDAIYVGRSSRVPLQRDADFWQPVHAFLDRLVASQGSELAGESAVDFSFQLASLGT